MGVQHAVDLDHGRFIVLVYWMGVQISETSNRAGIGVDGFGPQAFKPEVSEMALVVLVDACALCVDGDSHTGFSSRMNATSSPRGSKNGREEYAARFHPHGIPPHSGFVQQCAQADRRLIVCINPKVVTLRWLTAGVRHYYVR